MKKITVPFLFSILIAFFSSCQDTKDIIQLIDCDFPTVEVPASEIDSLQNWLDIHGVTATEDARGFFYIIDSIGDDERAQHCYDVILDYKCYLLDGSFVDMNTNTGFRISQTIKGFGYGLSLVGNGGRITIFLPPSLAYGEKGSSPAVGPNDYLIFELYVRSMIKNDYPY